jgi:hypothetical protein
VHIERTDETVFRPAALHDRKRSDYENGNQNIRYQPGKCQGRYPKSHERVLSGGDHSHEVVPFIRGHTQESDLFLSKHRK